MKHILVCVSIHIRVREGQGIATQHVIKHKQQDTLGLLTLPWALYVQNDTIHNLVNKYISKLVFNIVTNKHPLFLLILCTATPPPTKINKCTFPCDRMTLPDTRGCSSPSPPHILLAPWGGGGSNVTCFCLLCGVLVVSQLSGLEKL